MVTVAVLTSNCAKQKQTEYDLSQLIDETLSVVATAPEIVAVGFQEVAPIHETCFRHQETYLRPFIGSMPSDYALVAQSVCGGTGLLVFAHRKAPTITEIQTDTTAFGWLWSSLKGAALVSLKFGNTGELHLVCAHLAAGSNHVNERNRDFALMYSAFDLMNKPGQALVFGDLNYRTQNGQWATDELTNELVAERTAWGLKEASVAFQPTYKFAMGTDDYESNRIKSYCDRVLYRPLNGSTKVLHYSSAQTKLYTDHHPVKLVIETGLSLETDLSITSENGGNVSATNSFAAMKPLSAWSLANHQLNSYLADVLIGSVLYPIATKQRQIVLGTVLTLGVIYAVFFR